MASYSISVALLYPCLCLGPTLMGFQGGGRGGGEGGGEGEEDGEGEFWQCFFPSDVTPLGMCSPPLHNTHPARALLGNNTNI